MKATPQKEWVNPRTGLRPPEAWAKPITAHQQRETLYQPTIVSRRLRGDNFELSLDFSRDLAGHDWGEPGTVSIVAFPDEASDYFGSRGMVVRVVNRTGNEIRLHNADNDLFIIQEALTQGNVWKPIECNRTVDCGCSYFTSVPLKSNHYCEMASPLYDGPMRARIRFRLMMMTWDGMKSQVSYLYSNSFNGSISGGQLEPPRGNDD